VATYHTPQTTEVLAAASAGLSVPQFRSVVPPNRPWQELVHTEQSMGYLSIYYSDNLSPLAVRFVTKPGDYKSDPNLETATYGLFSVCSSAMRAGVVKRGSEYVFFACSRDKRRVLTGYYHVRWYARGVLGNRDYCLAADRVRFLAEPIPLTEIDRLCGTDVSKKFRGMRLLTTEHCHTIADIVDSYADATADYLAEIDRLERFNLRHTGYRYPTWRRKEKFSWDLAEGLLGQGQFENQVAKISNSSPSELWRCKACAGTVTNKALLKQCPYCRQVATLEPLDPSSIPD
jgi:hypothetical protein